MYTFGKSVVKKEMGMGIEDFLTHYNNHEKFGITIVKMLNKEPVKNSKYLVLDANQIVKYLNTEHLDYDKNLKTIMGDVQAYTQLKNGDKRYYWY